jgi:hypothetical protein
VYCVPKSAESTADTLSIMDMLAKIESNMKIPYDKRVFEKDEAHKEKLIALSVMYRLRLPQTSKSKQLAYPHLVLCKDNDEPIIFYPQIRRGANGGKISISDYLTSLLEGHVKSLVEIPALKDHWIENLNLLREGYVNMAEETKSVAKEWEAADTAWPE